jgi:hypothetical protein
MDSVTGNFFLTKRLHRSSAVLLTLLTFLMLQIGTIEAEEKKEESSFPQTGTLASSNPGSKTNSVDVWSDENAKDTSQAPPISGSVSKVNGKDWIAKIFNNSDAPISANIAVVQLDKLNRKLNTQYFSVSLKPGESVDRKVNASSTTNQCYVELRGWKKKSVKSQKAEVAESSPPAESSTQASE